LTTAARPEPAPPTSHAMSRKSSEAANRGEPGFSPRGVLHRLHAKLQCGPGNGVAPELEPLMGWHVIGRDHSHRVRPQSKSKPLAVEPRDGDPLRLPPIVTDRGAFCEFFVRTRPTRRRTQPILAQPIHLRGGYLAAAGQGCRDLWRR
jgi:hypothetical protein